ncbi:MAG: hypothetical protein KDD29_04860 [Flavobacteriales bacterium]|nr:hypothetical protein [Flavobacteriales bacterium]
MELLIQKISNCCSKEVLDLFHSYLIKNNQILSSKLIDVISKSPNETIKFYAKHLYKNDSNDSIKKLNQLAYHTIKLSSFISQHFPTFLWHNVSKIEWLIFKNKEKEYNQKIKILKEVAEKFENYSLLIHLSTICKQQKSLDKTLSNSFLKTNYLQHYNEIEKLIQLQNKILDDNISRKRTVTKNELSQFSNLFKSKSKSVEILAKQSYLNVLSTCNHSLFYEENTLKLIKETIQLTEKYGYLIIAQYTEKLMSLDYMLVKHTRLKLDEKEMNKACSSIIKKWQNHFSSNGKLDVGLTMAISIKGSYYITNYYFNQIPRKLENEIKEIIPFIDSLIQNTDWNLEGHLKYINLCNVYALYLTLDHQSYKAIQIIEKILHEYQQKQFNKLYDGIFVILIMAYFQAKKYDEVTDTYNRFKKITKGEISVKENELIIKALYYLAQLKLKQSNQYHNKLSKVIEELATNKLMKNNLQLIERVQKAIQ